MINSVILSIRAPDANRNPADKLLQQPNVKMLTTSNHEGHDDSLDLQHERKTFAVVVVSFQTSHSNFGYAWSPTVERETF
jgi:hypothetical protein